ncbi:MAG: tRNA 2-thiouridine(34) synthase MnmA [Candidatus Omnitrophica bacterium]|nr:tRNA 2-thiouridine(34) synthase MnmA [Candidatus Omnitrophota bacterium]
MASQDKQINKGKKVFVAMSGGVDSSVTAVLMKEQGYDVTGVTMCFSVARPDSQKPSCGGVDGITDAQRVAQVLDIPHYVLDFAKDIKIHVIDNFTNEYLNGRTPNPCVRCNQYLKFGALYEKVMSLGADFLATGHYAKIHYDSKAARYEIKKAQDLQKDQSYFLYSINKEILPKILFPLGDKLKNEVRELARKYQLNVARKRESQDICFVPDTGYKSFICDRLGNSVFEPGHFKNYKGEIVGEHKGIFNYTIGQRDQLGIALGTPVYVYKIDKRTNTVYIGPQECLYAQGLTANQFNPVSMNIPTETMEVYARIRYNAREVKGFLTHLGGDRIRVEFARPQQSVTPGQSVVLYHDDVLLAGAVIEETI